MQIKTLEIRDSMTCIPVLAIQVTPNNLAQAYYCWRTGFITHDAGIIVVRMSDAQAACDPYDWPSRTGDSRTMVVAHEWITAHYDELVDGDVVDVEFILGETKTKKTSERFAYKGGLCGIR